MKYEAIEPPTFTSSQDTQAKVIRTLAIFFGGILLGLASGGSVFLAAKATGLLASVSLNALALLGSIVLAAAWGLIYYKEIDVVLVNRIVCSKEHQAINKFNKQFEKDAKLFHFLKSSIQNPPEIIDAGTETITVDDYLQLKQLQYLISKQLVEDYKAWKFSANLYGFERKIRGVLLNKDMTPTKTWIINGKTDPVNLPSFLGYHKDIPANKYGFTAAAVLDKITNTKIRTKLESVFTPELFDEFGTNADALSDEKVELLLSKKMNALFIDAKNAGYHKSAGQLINDNYSTKLQSKSFLTRTLITFIDYIAITNATLVNTIGMGIGGVSLVSAIATAMGITLSLTASTLVMTLFAMSGFAAAFFLTRSTMKQAVRAFAKYLNAPEENSPSAARNRILKDHMNRNSEEKDNKIKGKLPMFLKILLSALCAVGFAGFNLITGMSAVAIFMNPANLLKSDLVIDLVTKPQPWFVQAGGLFSAAITAAVVFSFMLKFCTSKTPQSNKATQDTNFGVQSFIIASALLNTFVCGMNYFNGGLFANLWANYLGVTSPLLINGFGAIMVLAVLVIGMPVFEELKSRCADIFQGNKSASGIKPTPSNSLTATQKAASSQPAVENTIQLTLHHTAVK